jgi:hypothetical protein
MASEKTLVANKQNAQLSTGPISNHGKAIVRYNALKHGLRAEHLLLPGEDEGALEALREGLSADLEPCGTLQWCLFDLILGKLWRLRRVCSAETLQLQECLSLSIPGINEGIGRALQSSRLSDYEHGLENALFKAIAQYHLLKFSDVAANKGNGFVR